MKRRAWQHVSGSQGNVVIAVFYSGYSALLNITLYKDNMGF